ncbi:MAG: serine hydrolase, partial [Pseudomonadota bacterium]
ALEAARAGEIDLQNRVRVSERAASRGGSSMHLRAGDRPRLEDLLMGVMALSGNDAATAVAEAVAGSERAFVARMNAAAEALGLQTSRFRNATGLPAAGHVMSARDVAQLTLALMARYPGASRFSTPLQMTWNGVDQPNRNPLLALDFSDMNAKVDGVKTGYTRAAGFGGVFTARRDPARRSTASLEETETGAATGPTATAPAAPSKPTRVLVVLAGLGSEAARQKDGARALRWALARSSAQGE